REIVVEAGYDSAEIAAEHWGALQDRIERQPFRDEPFEKAEQLFGGHPRRQRPPEIFCLAGSNLAVLEIDVDRDDAARAQHAVEAAEGGGGIGRVLQDAVAE